MAAPFVHERHDIGIVRTSLAEVGMMLAKDKSGLEKYALFDDEYLASQFFTGVPGYGSLPTEKEIAIRQDDWRSGFGQEIYDSDDPKRYFSSIGMDLRHKGMAIAGPTPTTVTIPTAVITTAAALANTDMELAASWTGGSRGTTPHAGTYSWDVNNANAWQNATTFATSWQGKEFHMSCWAKASTASTARIALLDDGGVTYSSYHTGGNTWECLNVKRTIDGAATYVRAIMYGDTATICHFDDLALGSPVAGAIVRFLDFNDKHYMFHGTMVSKQNASGTAFDLIWTCPGVITDAEVFTDDKVYIALGTSTPYQEMTTAELFCQNMLASNTFQFFKTVHAATPVIWGNDGVNTICSNTDPSDSGANAWSGQTTVDTSYHSITDLMTKSGALYIPKEDMIYYLDSSGNVQNDLAPKLQALTSSTSGKNAITDGQKIMYPCGAQSLLEIDGTTLTWRSPAQYCTNLSDFVGQVFAVYYDDQYWFAIVGNSTKLEILAGRSETIDSTTSFVWHPIAEIPDVHEEKDTTQTISSADASNQATLDTLLNEIKADYNTHIASTTYHLVADATNVVTSAASSNEATAVTLSNEIKADYNAHRSQAGVHAVDDPDNEVTTANSTNLATAITLANEIKTDFNAHLIVGISCETCFVSSVYQKRLWIASTSSSDNLYYIPLPTGYGDITNDANRLFKTGTYFITPFLHGNFKGDDKGFIKLTLDMGNTSSTVYFEAHYQLFGSTNWTEINPTAKFKTSPSTSGFIPVDDVSAAKPVETMIRFKIVAVTGDTDDTPILYGYDCRALLYPSRRSIIACTVRCENEVTLKDGTQDKASYDTIKATIDEARIATWPFSFYDIFGDTKTVKMLPLPSNVPFWRPTKMEKGRKPELEFNLLLQEVTLS